MLEGHEVAVVISRSEAVPDKVEEILRGLPEWFGIEEALTGYAEQARVLPTYAATDDGDTVGVCLVRRHNRYSAEIYLLAVKRALHRQRIGKELLAEVERDLAEAGTEFVQAKTLGEAHESPEYAATRKFYEALGYRALEEFDENTIWSDNPCLVMVKSLSP